MGAQRDLEPATERGAVDGGHDGADSFSVQYQNANNSVRVTDEFMRAVHDDADWNLTAVTTGEVLETVRARDLWRQMAEAAWECADPGLQFDTTINRWHTVPNAGRITASNPCFTGDALVHTDKGLIRFDELFARANTGEEFRVWTHDATSPDAPARAVTLTSPEAFMITGKNPVQRLRFDNGMELRCTPSHRLFTKNRGYVEAADLTPDDRVMSLDLPAPATEADWSIPVASSWERDKGERDDPLYLPQVWTEDFAHYVGWLIGDGTTSGQTTATVYGSADDRTEILPWHQELVEQINGGRPLKVSEQANGTAQLRLSRKSFKRYLESLGVASVTGEHKRIPWSIEQAPPEVVAAFLRGLFDADGCVVNQVAKGTAYVGLGSISIELLRGTQRMLSTFGISSHIYNVRKAGESTFRYSGKDGVERRYQHRAGYDLRITGKSVERFAASVGFMLVSEARQVVEAGVRASEGLLRRRHDGAARRPYRRRHRAHVQPVRASEPLIRRERHRGAQLLGVPVTRQLGLQSGVDQPAAVPRRRRHVRRRRLHAHGRRRVHRGGNPGRPCRLPDREDRCDHPRVPSTRHGLRQPRGDADGPRTPVRLRRGASMGGRDHVADDRHGVRHERPDRRRGSAPSTDMPTTPSRRCECSACTAMPAGRSPRPTAFLPSW